MNKFSKLLVCFNFVFFPFNCIGQTTFSGNIIKSYNVSDKVYNECIKLSKYDEYLKRKNKIQKPKFFGVGYQIWNQKFLRHNTSDNSIIEGAAIGGNLNHVHFNVYLTKEQLFIHNDITPTYSQTIDFIKKMKSNGGMVNLKLGFWNESQNFWMGTYQPKNIELFFDEWEKQLLFYAEIAQKTNTEILTIAYEFNPKITDSYEKKWIKIIKNIRKVFTGKLSVNFTRANEGFNSKLLKYIDIVEVSLFTKSTRKKNPTIEELVKSWFKDAKKRNHILRICKLSKISQKPILIGDIAFLSLDGSNTTYNKFKNKLKPFQKDEKEQSDQIEAIFSIVERYPEIISGINLLTWFPFDSTVKTEFHSWSNEVGPLGRSFRGKLAEQTVKNWFEKWDIR